MTAARDLLALPALALFQVKQLARTSFFLQTALAAPAAFMLLRLTAGVESRDLWFDGLVAGIWATTTTATGMLGYQRYLGTFELLLASPRRPGVVFGAIFTAAAALGLVGLPVAVALQVASGSAPVVGAQQALGVTVGLVACVASAHVLAAAFVATRRATAFEPLLLVPVWLLVGVVIPAQAMPRPVEILALLHPLASAVRAERATTPTDALIWALTSLVLSVGWLVVGVRLLARAQDRTAVRGTSGVA